MKKKIIGILICMLLIATAVPAVESLKNNAMNTTVPSSPLITMAGWNETQKLIATDCQQKEDFGWSVSLDGDTALIGARNDDDNGIDSGSAYVFIRNGTNWTQQAKLHASDAAAGDYFGVSVSLDGDTALIGAQGVISNSGSAYVFIRNGTNWTQQAKLHASDAAASDYFGHAVSLDGDTALIGAYGDNYATGSVYVFTRTGTTWTEEEQRLHASIEAPSDWFGWSVSLDGDTALIGAQGVESFTGSVYVFTRTGTTWTQKQKLNDSRGKEFDYFGHAVSLDGDNALIGADEYSHLPPYLPYGPGKAFVFTCNGTTWTQQQRELHASDPTTGDLFGGSVSLSGNIAIIGARYNDDNGTNSGSAYVFIRTDTNWTQQANLHASDGNAEDLFGWSVSLDGDTALIGANGDDGSTGAVYVFTKSGNQPPSQPRITGEVSGEIQVPYDYYFNSIDPEGDEVSYYIDWGDGTNSGWVGPYPSGNEINQTHKWDGCWRITCTLKAKARDSNGNESDWATLTVTMPCSYKPLPQFFELLFQRFPNAFPLLRYLLGY
jgi:hypothetical protein